MLFFAEPTVLDLIQTRCIESLYLLLIISFSPCQQNREDRGHTHKEKQ